MRWKIAIAFSAFFLGTLVGSWSAEAPAAKDAATPVKAMEFFPITPGSGLQRVGQEMLGIVIQDVGVSALKTRGDTQEYRLRLRVRNPGRQPVSANVRIVLWGDAKPLAAFDIRGGDEGVFLAPRTVTRFSGDFKLAKDVKVSRFALLPLPPRTPLARADQPLANPPAKTEEGKTQAPELTPEQQQQMARYQTEVERRYAQQAQIPGVNGMGQFMGIGPYGPTYGVPGGGMFVPAPSGWVDVRGTPSLVNPNALSISVAPF